MTRHPILTVMPDYGMGPFLWIKPDGEEDTGVGGNCCSYESACGLHPMSQDLLRDFSSWVAQFGRAAHIRRGKRDDLDLDWVDFHARGLALAIRLKQEVGSAFRVIYQKPCEDANSIHDERREILDDGKVLLLPRRAALWSQSLRRMISAIVSGGQTGVDRAALDWAIAHNLDHAGWVPKGRRAEDGVVDSRYHLRETSSPEYFERTRQNVLDSDATLIVNMGVLDGGTLKTKQVAERAGKPFFVAQVDSVITTDLARQILTWLRAHPVSVLNIAGPRESKRPGIYDATCRLLDCIDEVGRSEARAMAESRGLV